VTMIGYLIRRIPSAVLVLFATSVLAFVLPRLAPGDPATTLAGPEATTVEIDAIRADLGLDRPLLTQYLDWLGHALRGDFGTSYVTGRPVVELIADRAGSTVQLAVLAGALMVVLGLALGLAAGAVGRGRVRTGIDVLCTVLLAMPAFLSGLLLVLLLGIAVPILPVSGEVSLLDDPEIGIQYLILPALALALPQAAAVARLLRSAMDQARREEYVRTAVAKGVPARQIVVRHVLRNSLSSSLVTLGIRFGEILGGAIVVEAVFARSGLGELAVTSVYQRDYVVLQALTLIAVGIAVLTQLLTEIGLATLDPRIRLGATK